MYNKMSSANKDIELLLALKGQLFFKGMGYPHISKKRKWTVKCLTAILLFLL